MHKGAKFRQIGDVKQLICIIFLKKQSRWRQDMKTVITEVKKKKTSASQFKTNTLGVSTTEKVTNIIHKLDVNQN